MEVRYLTDRNSYKKMSTAELSSLYLVETLFEPDEILMVYCDVDRSITGSAVPIIEPLVLKASKKEMAAEFFLERRELGIINIGGPGTVKTDNGEFKLEHKDGLYVGRGVKLVEFSSDDHDNPAQFYFNSYPAHTAYETKLVKYSEAVKVNLGSVEQANKRTINKYFLPGHVETCQLVMGLTELEPGSVWNTMPAHTHQRRSEVYMYFNIDPDAFVVHLMGEPSDTRHIIIRNKQAVLSSSWSLHSGCGTKAYSFIWGMGGENQEFDDMDWIPMENMK